MKNKSHFVYKRNFKRLVICRREYFTAAMQSLIQNPEICFENPVRYFKNMPGDTTTVGLMKMDEHLLVIKRYNIKNFFHGLKLFFRKSRAMYSWINAHHLLELGIPTIEPIAIIEKRFGPLRNNAYFIYKYVEGIRGSEFLKQTSPFTAQFDHAVKAMATLVKKLSSSKIYHADLHHDNLMIVDDKILLIDLDHMKKYRFLKKRFHKAHQRDVKKFIKYLEDHKEAREIFLKEML